MGKTLYEKIYDKLVYKKIERASKIAIGVGITMSLAGFVTGDSSMHTFGNYISLTSGGFLVGLGVGDKQYKPLGLEEKLDKPI